MTKVKKTLEDYREYWYIQRQLNEISGGESPRFFKNLTREELVLRNRMFLDNLEEEEREKFLKENSSWFVLDE